MESSLLQLPREIRDKIYEHMFRGKRILMRSNSILFQRCHHNCQNLKGSPLDRTCSVYSHIMALMKDIHCLNFLYINQQVRKEALQTLCRQATLVLTSPHFGLEYLQNFPLADRTHIRSISLVMHVYSYTEAELYRLALEAVMPYLPALEDVDIKMHWRDNHDLDYRAWQLFLPFNSTLGLRNIEIEFQISEGLSFLSVVAEEFLVKA